MDLTLYERLPGVPERVAAGGVVGSWHLGRLQIALARESDLPGLVLPKGGVDPGETIEEAAEREIIEETGLTHLVRLSKLGIRERMNWGRTRWVVTHYFLYASPHDRGHAGLVWAPIDALPEMFWPEQRALVDENRERIEAELSRYRLYFD